MSDEARVLIVEDLPTDAELAEREVRTVLAACTCRRVETADAFREALREFQPTLIISDYKMPEFDGLTALKIAIETVPETPFIIVTGSMNEDTAVDCLKAGAWDYVIKEHIKRLGPAVRSAVEKGELLKNRRRSEAELLKLTEAVRQSPVSLIITNTAGDIEYVNPRFTAVSGYEWKDVIGRNPRVLKSGETPAAEYRRLWETIASGHEWRGTFHNRRKDGTLFWEQASISAIRNERGEITHFLAVKEDITERKALEDRIRESEQHYRILVETSPDAILIADPTGTISFHSPRNREIFRLAPDEPVNGESILRWVHEEERSRVINRMREIIGEEKPSEMREYRLKRSDGTSFWGEIASTPLRNSEGAIDRLLIICRDITSRRMAEQKMAEQARLLDIARDAITVRGSGDELQYWNRGAERLFGWTAEEAGALPITDMVPEEERDAYQMAKEALLRDGEWEGMPRFLTKDGRLRVLSTRMTLISESPERPASSLVLQTDVTEQQELESQLRRSQRLEGLGTLASGIAHDFNNILGILLGHVSLIARIHTDADRLKESIDTMQKAVARGISLVRQMLTFARKTEATPEPLQANTLIKELVKMLQETFPKTIELRPRLDGNLPEVLADPTQLHQVLLNLCVNARDAMPNGGTLTIATSSLEGSLLAARSLQAPAPMYVVVSVKDSGVGMDEEIQQRIFEPFFTTKSLGQGTGLGLSVVHGIVESHGGFVEVESSPGRGTTFRVFLPVRVPVAPGPITASTDHAVPTRGTETILIIEDEPALSRTTALALELDGYTAMTARDGDEGLGVFTLHHTRIDLVFTDLDLPKMKGIDLVRAIRSVDREIPIIAASGFIEPETKAALVHSGINHFLQKPYAPSDVIRIIRELLDRQQP